MPTATPILICAILALSGCTIVPNAEGTGETLQSFVPDATRRFYEAYREAYA